MDMSANLLDLEERIRLAVRIGESHYREFKSAFEGPPGGKSPRPLKAIMENVGRTLVAFANADGGELIIGVEDDGRVTGVPFDSAQMQYVLDAVESYVHTDTPLPTPRKGVVNIDDSTVLYFYDPNGTEYVYLTSKGVCLMRVDRDCLPVGSEKLQATRLEDKSRSWDRQIAPGASLSDLDLDLVATVAGQITYGVSVEKCLQYLDLAEFGLSGIVLKKAALLLFAKDIRRWHPGCLVRILVVDGLEKKSGEDFNIVRDEMVSGNILRLIDQSWERLNAELIQQTSLTAQARFKQSFFFAQIACREALTNAIVHRNYAVEGRGIEISIFSDRLEIKSPGMLLSTISLDDLRLGKGAHESRNALVARVLRELGFVREMGEGIRRIYDVMRSNALAEPTFANDSQGFSVVLSSRSMYDSKVKLWLSNFERFELTQEQLAVVALGFGGRTFSTQEVIDRLGLVDTGRVGEILTPLRELSVLRRALSHKQAMMIARQKKVPKREVPVFQVALGSESGKDPLGEEPSEDSEFRQTFEPGIADAGAAIFFANIPLSSKRSDLFEFLSNFGEVSSIHVPDDQYYGNSNRGYGFATIIARDSTPQQLVERIDGSDFGGQKVHCKTQRSKSR
ncbi:MAG: ATP-binding protein [Acidobacteriota bacterium]